MNDVVRAAGCVLWRADGNRPEVLIIHRPRYDDWSFPKGKLDPGETDEECAVREVEEETGLTGELGPELPAVEYVDQKGRQKVVRYWLLYSADGSFEGDGQQPDRFEPNDEVDQLAWVDVDEAAERLTYGHDVTLLGEAVAAIQP